VSGIELRATLEIVLAGGFCGALGFWVLSERLAYAGESLSHGLLPGLVLAALADAPLRAWGRTPARLSRSPAWWGWDRCSPSRRTRRSG
jgi:ABC-type Mn2+/Zn2+ transport system permease subunit